MKPLNETYKTIQTSATKIETFAMCPYMYKFQPEKFDNEEALLFGTHTWAILESFLMWEDRWYALADLIARQYPEHAQYGIFYNNIPAYKEYLKDKEAICAQFKMTCEIEMWDYLIILSGTTDPIFINQDWKYIIADYKTAKQERTQETMNTKIQKYLYSFLYAQFVWREKLGSFDYLINTKHALPKPKKDWSKSTREWPRFAVWSYVPEQKYIEDYMFNLFDYFCRSYTDNYYTTKQDVACFYCKLRNTSCPCYNQSIPVATNSDQNLPF